MRGEDVCYYERKGNSSGKNHEPQYEEDRHHTDGSRRHERPDPRPHRHGPGREPGSRGRGERGDRPRGPCAARPSAGRPGRGADPAFVREHHACAGPEREGARQYGAERAEDGRRRGLDAREHRGRERGKDARRSRDGRGGVHGMGHAAPCDDVPPGQEHHDE